MDSSTTIANPRPPASCSTLDSTVAAVPLEGVSSATTPLEVVPVSMASSTPLELPPVSLASSTPLELPPVSLAPSYPVKSIQTSASTSASAPLASASVPLAQPSTSTSTHPQGLLMDTPKGPKGLSISFKVPRNRLNTNTGMSHPRNIPFFPGPSATGSHSSVSMPSHFGHSSHNSTSTSTKDLMALLGDLKQSQMMVENDQKALEQNRLELIAVSGKIKQLSQKKVTVQKQIGDGEVAYAELASELSLVVIKDKVLAESLEKLQGDLSAGWERLTFLRTKVSSLSSRYLGECLNFARMYNCTEMGAQNRSKAMADELEEMRVSKHQLEYDLQKFLSMRNEVHKSEEENKDLQQQYREQEETDRKKELEAYNKLNEMERLLEQLEKRKASLDRSLQEETNKLQTKLETTKKTISFWERRVSENQRMVGQQKNAIQTSTAANTINSATSPGFPSIITQGSIRLGNGQTVSTNNKIPRVSQYVRPTPQVSVSNPHVSVYNPHVSVSNPNMANIPIKPNATKEVQGNSRKTIQTKLQFTTGKPINSPPIKPTKPKFTPPCVNVVPTFASKSVPAPNNGKNLEDEDPFNDSFPSSQYFKMPMSKTSSNTSTLSNNNPNASYQNNNISYENKSTSFSSTAAGRTFQFKKKCVEGPGPTTPCRTSSIPLGTMPLPFSSFQNGRTILQEKQQLQDDNEFDYNMDTTTNY